LRACERAELYVKIVRENNIPFEERGPLQILMGEDFFILLHEVMFVPSLQNLADDEQLSWWLAKAHDYKILGTYAQTELTHGSNVRGLQTSATYDESMYDGEGGWNVHTPSLEGMKWWPGGLAKSCNCVILMARVVIKGVDYGPHPFFFQVRDFETHASLPGVELRDIGAKMGYNGMDNGGMRITNVKIPRRHLLGKYVQVSKEGVYTKVGNQKMLFGTMSYTRLKISTGAGLNLAKACTTAIRYSAVRRQFAMQRTQFGEDVSLKTEGEKPDDMDAIVKPAKRSEAQVLDYSSQQYLLFPQLALAFAMHFTSEAGTKSYDHYIAQFKAENFKGLPEMHVLTSTLKAVSTVLAADGMEQCRKSLGGHGFLNAAGIGPQYLNALPQATYEGDFVVLSIQVGMAVFKACGRKLMKGLTKDPNNPSLDYLFAADLKELKTPTAPSLAELQAGITDFDFLERCMEKRANFVHFSAAQKFQEAVKQHGSMNANAIDEVKIDMMRMTYAHSYVLYVKGFRAKLDALKEGPLHKVLVPLFELFCLTIMDSGYEKGGGFGEFAASGALPASPAAFAILRARVKVLLAQLRPNAVSLVDAWNVPDYLLNSCLGRYDGRVYEALYEQTLYEPLNKTDIATGYYQHLQYILHPERRESGAQIEPQTAKL
jgi:acyl-CoA oxidase